MRTCAQMAVARGLPVSISEILSRIIAVLSKIRSPLPAGRTQLTASIPRNAAEGDKLTAFRPIG
ncbi:hypothetical protein BMI90_06330 [Thioclava sp. L04-15]|nr:hypothetical protein BMI90_06330 [Thioclava sp. L04-15]